MSKQLQSLAQLPFSQNVTSIKAVMWEPAMTVRQEPLGSQQELSETLLAFSVTSPANTSLP